MSGALTRYWPHAGSHIQIRPPRQPIAKSVPRRGRGRWPEPRCPSGGVLRSARTQWRWKNDDGRNLRGINTIGFRRSRGPWLPVEFGLGATPSAARYSIAGYATLRKTHLARNGPPVSQLFSARGGSRRGHRPGAARRKTKLP